MKLPVQYAELSPHQRRQVREHYQKLQSNLCYHCGASLFGPPRPEVKAMQVNPRLFPPDFFTWSVHLHHHHVTGWTLGAVHAYCNAVLWTYKGE